MVDLDDDCRRNYYHRKAQVIFEPFLLRSNPKIHGLDYWHDAPVMHLNSKQVLLLQI